MPRNPVERRRAPQRVRRRSEREPRPRCCQYREPRRPETNNPTVSFFVTLSEGHVVGKATSGSFRARAVHSRPHRCNTWFCRRVSWTSSLLVPFRRHMSLPRRSPLPAFFASLALLLISACSAPTHDFGPADVADSGRNGDASLDVRAPTDSSFQVGADAPLA